MRKFFAISLCVALGVAMLSGCSPLEGGLRDKVIAKVGKKKLRTSEAVAAIPAGLPAEDSLRMLEDYIEQWARRELKLQEAERVIGSSAVAEVNRMVEEYRYSLLGYRLDQNYLDMKVDTLLSDSVVTEYWEQHKADFALDRTVVKGRIVRVPNSYRQAVKLLSLMRSPSEDRQKDFISTCEKNNFETHFFEEEWVDFSEFLSYLPVRRDRSYDYMLDSKEVREMADADNHYFVQITDCLRAGSDAPFDRVGDAVKRIIFNRRRNQVIKEYEDSLYNASLTEGRVQLMLDKEKEEVALPEEVVLEDIVEEEVAEPAKVEADSVVVEPAAEITESSEEEEKE